MKFIGPYTLLLPGEGWNTCTDRYFTTFEIYFNLRTGIIDVLETKKDNKMGHTIRNSQNYASPVEFIFEFCKPRKLDIRDYTDITELEPGVECLLYCYLFILYERMINLTINDECDHDGCDV